MRLKELCGVPTLRWAYEQAFATDFILKLHRDHEPDVLAIEDLMNMEFGCSPDNKTTFELRLYPSAVHYYITFHDNTIYVGLGVRPYGAGPLPKGQEPKSK